jgi:hypothetical protein
LSIWSNFGIYNPFGSKCAFWIYICCDKSIQSLADNQNLKVLSSEMDPAEIRFI